MSYPGCPPGSTQKITSISLGTQIKFQNGYLTLEPSKESAGLEKVSCVLKRKKIEDFFSIVMILEWKRTCEKYPDIFWKTKVFIVLGINIIQF